jgi:hypothetical protein
MADLSDLQAQLDELLRAYRSGVRTVAYDGKSVVYGSGDEMRAAIASLQRAISGAPVPVGIVRSSKGF